MAARISADVGDPSAFRSGAAFVSYVGVAPGTRPSGKWRPLRARFAVVGNAGLRAALWMPTLVAVRRSPWLCRAYQRLRARGKAPKVALIVAMRKLLVAIYSVAKSRRPFIPILQVQEV
jgi:transposase